MFKSDLAKRLKCEDRGPVSNNSDGITSWHNACSLCSSRAHVVILANGERKLACPKCLLILKEKDQEEMTLQTLKKLEKMANK